MYPINTGTYNVPVTVVSAKNKEVDKTCEKWSLSPGVGGHRQERSKHILNIEISKIKQRKEIGSVAYVNGVRGCNFK